MSDYAKGLEGVIANESALSKVEGADGRLSYLGYSIVYHVEIAFLFITIAVLGPLVRLGTIPSNRDEPAQGRVALAEFPT